MQTARIKLRSMSRLCCKPGGVFAFSVEAHEGDGFVWASTCRYRHSKTYLESLAEAHGFAMFQCSEIVVCYEFEQPVAGHVCLLERKA